MRSTLKHGPLDHTSFLGAWTLGAYCLRDRLGEMIPLAQDEGSGLLRNGTLGSQGFRAQSRKMSVDSRWALPLTPQSLPRGEGVARTARVLSKYLLVSYVYASATLVTWAHD